MPATGGLQAFQRLAVRRPDLILLDLLMPEMDGFEVCRRIRENPDWAEIPIIFLSSADDKGLIVRALESGGVDYITKPFNHAELVTRVRTHLALKRARDELKQLAEDRDELLGILTHDLKNHLGGMDMSAQLLRDRTEAMADPKLRLMAENISHSSSQMLAFVKEFLANASADHGLSHQDRADQSQGRSLPGRPATSGSGEAQATRLSDGARGGRGSRAGGPRRAQPGAG